MVKQLFIINDVTAFAADIAGVKAGKLGIMKLTDGTAAPVFASTITAGSTVAFTKGDKTSVDVKTKDLVKTQLAPYSGGTAQKIKVTLAAPASEDKYIKLIEVTIGTANVPLKTFFGANAAAVVAKINAEGADPASPFFGYSAAAALEVVTVTAPIGQIARVAASEGSVIEYTVIPVLPEGTVAKVKKLEDDCLVYEGWMNRVGFPVIRPDSEVEAGATYDMLYCDFLVSKPTKDGSRTQSLEKIKIIFAVKKAATPVVTAAALQTEIAKLA